MTKTKKETGLAVTSKDELNENLRNALKTIDEKLAALGAGVAAVQFKTGGTFYQLDNGVGTGINVFQCTDLHYLLKSLAILQRTKKEYEEAAISVELRIYPAPMFSGYLLDNWVHDFEQRIKVVANAAQIQELNKSKQELTTFLSAEDRLKETLTKAANLLK